MQTAACLSSAIHEPLANKAALMPANVSAKPDHFLGIRKLRESSPNVRAKCSRSRRCKTDVYKHSVSSLSA